jgi:GT2 family glycosyltransferase
VSCASDNSSQLVVVLGMHRSGTSAIARALQVLGVDLGGDLIPPKKDNDKGFFEDIDVVNFNIDALSYLQTDWHCLSPVTSADVDSLSKVGFLLRAVELLRAKISGKKIFGLKDPRMAKLLPFWVRVFSHCEVDVRYVIAIRHPLSVTNSLAMRDQLERTESYLLWLGHVVPALTGSRGCQRVLVDYDRLLERPALEIGRIADALSLEVDSAELDVYLSEFLQEDLRHSRYALHDLLVDESCPVLVHTIYAQLLSVAADKASLDDEASEIELNIWAADFLNMRAQLLYADKLIRQKLDLTSLLSGRDVSIVHLNDTVLARDELIGSLVDTVSLRDGDIASLNDVLLALDDQVNSLNLTLYEQGTLAEAEREELQRFNLRLVDQVASLIASRSWQLTKPWRVLGRFASRVKRFVRNLSLLGSREGLRSLSAKYSFLRTLRAFYLHKKIKLLAFSQSMTISSNNRAALNELSARRFGSEMLSPPLVDKIEWPEIDISVVAFNSSRWVRSFLESLIAQCYPLANIHLRVIDHGSIDDTVLLFEALLSAQGHKFASAQVIQQENLGFGAGHDRAIREGRSEFCLVVNLDLEFFPGSITKALHVALQDKGTSAASWEFRQIPYEHPKYYDPVTLETNWSSHACILFRRDAYLRCGGYDAAIFMYAEDVELSYRFRSFGYTLKYLPAAVVRHHTYASAGEVKPLQYVGSVLGNAYVRLRYGSVMDRLAAFGLYGRLLVCPEPFKGAKALLLRNAFKLAGRVPHFVRGKGPVAVSHPFRGYDYELVRDGAFLEVEPVKARADSPLVSVITRTYQGRGMFLKQAMLSVFNQTYLNVELIVAEDGGDTQRDLVESIALYAPEHVNVRFLSNPKIGRSGVGNAAMAVAVGEYMMFLDDDDLLFADHIEVLMGRLTREPTLSAAYGLSFEVHTAVAPDKAFYTEHSFHTPLAFHQEWDYSVLQQANFIPIQAIIFKRDLYERCGGFDLTLDQLEDWNLWLRYGYGQQFAFVAKTTSLFRTPADLDVRADRHALLHEAYEMAKYSAQVSIAQGVTDGTCNSIY